MSLRLAAAESTLPGRTLMDRFACGTEVGFDGIELGAPAAVAFADRAGELRAASAAGVVMPTAVSHMGHFIGDFDPDRRRDAIEQLKVIVSVMVEAGGVGLVTPHAFGLFSTRLPPFTPPRSDTESRRLLVEALRELGDHAVAVRGLIYLEPLNRFEDFVINTLADAVSVVTEADSPGVQVVADTFHMSIEEADIAASLTAAGPLIGHVQLGHSNRLEPGAGHYGLAGDPGRPGADRLPGLAGHGVRAQRAGS